MQWNVIYVCMDVCLLARICANLSMHTDRIWQKTATYTDILTSNHKHKSWHACRRIDWQILWQAYSLMYTPRTDWPMHRHALTYWQAQVCTYVPKCIRARVWNFDLHPTNIRTDFGTNHNDRNWHFSHVCVCVCVCAIWIDVKLLCTAGTPNSQFCVRISYIYTYVYIYDHICSPAPGRI